MVVLNQALSLNFYKCSLDLKNSPKFVCPFDVFGYCNPILHDCLSP